MTSQRSFLVIGATPLAGRVRAALAAEDGVEVRGQEAPDDSDLAVELGREPAAVAIAVRDDVAALRYALAVAHLSPEVPLVVTMFDRTVADQLHRLLPQVTVTSPADVAVPSLAGPCLGEHVEAAWVEDGAEHRVLLQDGEPVLIRRSLHRPSIVSRLRSVLGSLGSAVLGHQDAGTRLMITGLSGLLVVLLADWSWLVAHGHGLLRGFAEAARVVATVGPPAGEGDATYAASSGLGMLATMGFAALFTAGLVERLVGPRLVGFLGARSAPRSGHVVVVGMGQVGIRLCAELRHLGMRVVGVERDADAPQLRVARTLRIPVVIGHAGDRSQLVRLGLSRSRGLAAVGSNDLDNVAVAVTVMAVSPSTPVVLRAGEQEAIAETRSLLPLGTTRDVLHLASRYLVWTLLGERPVRVLAAGGATYVLREDGRLCPDSDLRGVRSGS
jgi:hypothetical protein